MWRGFILWDRNTTLTKKIFCDRKEGRIGIKSISENQHIRGAAQRSRIRSSKQTKSF